MYVVSTISSFQPLASTWPWLLSSVAVLHQWIEGHLLYSFIYHSIPAIGFQQIPVKSFSSKENI